MSIAEISHRVELTFWDWAIPTLTVSPLVQKSVCFFYRLLQKKTPLKRIWFAVALSLFGFTNGLVAFWLFAR